MSHFDTLMPAPAPPELRQRVIERVPEIGVRAAALENGVSPASASRWCRKAGVETIHPEQVANANAARAQIWADRRDRLAHEIGEAAELALEVATDLLEDGKVRDAQSAAVTMAILVDKAQLLTGAATTRSAVLSELDDEIERLTQKLSA